MMMNSWQNANSSMPTPMMMPMPMSMPMPTSSKEGDTSIPQQPIMCMMPVIFCDPSKMPKDMKMPNMPFPYFPYPMPYQQNTPETK